MIKLQYIDVFDNNKKKELFFSKHLIKREFREASLFALLVNGKSMEPVIGDKAAIVVDLSQKDFNDGDIYVLYYENNMWVKKYNAKDKNFISINPLFSHLVYEENDIHIVGRVLLTFTNL